MTTEANMLAETKVHSALLGEQLIETRLRTQTVSMSFLLAVFLFIGGFFGIHRFVLGRWGTGLLFILSLLLPLITLVWFVIDAFRLRTMLEENHAKIRNRIKKQINGSGF